MRSLLKGLLRKGLRLLPESTVLPVLSGPLLGARWILRSGNLGCWAGTYERENQRFVARTLRAGDLFVDAGANVGLFTLLGSRAVGSAGRVIAFEPLPENLAFLIRHVELNRSSNVRAEAVALAECPGRRLFGYGGSPSQARFDPSARESVEVDSLDLALARVGVSQVRLLKIDVEGAEALVLRGARKILTPTPPALLIATHGWRAHADCCELLSAMGIGGIQASLDEASGNGLILREAQGS